MAPEPTRRLATGTKAERRIVRCLKRYTAREVDRTPIATRIEFDSGDREFLTDSA